MNPSKEGGVWPSRDSAMEWVETLEGFVQKLDGEYEKRHGEPIDVWIGGNELKEVNECEFSETLENGMQRGNGRTQKVKVTEGNGRCS